jgi:hypothetical protein
MKNWRTRTIDEAMRQGYAGVRLVTTLVRPSPSFPGICRTLCELRHTIPEPDMRWLAPTIRGGGICHGSV